jgi:hypothetical protein
VSRRALHWARRGFHLIAGERCPRGGKEGDIAGTADPHGLPVLVPDLVIADKPLDDRGHDASFVLPHKIAIEFAVVVFVAIVDWDFETGDGRTIGRRPASRRQGGETGLPGRV